MLKTLLRSFQAPLAEGITVDAAEARKLILEGRAPANMQVTGSLDLSKSGQLERLPDGLHAESIDLSGCRALRELPNDLRLKCLKLNDCPQLRTLPDGLQCEILELRNSALRALPADLSVRYRLDLSGSSDLTSLSAGLAVGTLILRDCINLLSLPEGLNIFFLDISGCTGLQDWPEQGTIRFGHLRARGCLGLTTLPAWLDSVSQLDLRDCTGITQLPASLDVNAWIDIAGTNIQALPPTLAGVPLRWRGVPIDERIAFRPETIDVQEILGERNVERRRVMLERMGYAAFLSHADAKEIDRDEDPGGERRLLMVPQPNDEDLMCLAVYCPSTARQYIIRVPPTMRTCRQAAAWIAGFDNADDYQPIAET